MRENTAYVRNMVSGGKAGEEKCGILKNKTDKIFEVLFALPTDSSFRGSAWVIDPPTTPLPLLLYILQILRTILNQAFSFWKKLKVKKLKTQKTQ